jgi:hypothetical protein
LFTVLVMEEAVVLKVVVVTIPEGGLLTGGAVEVAAAFAAILDVSWSRLSKLADMRC